MSYVHRFLVFSRFVLSIVFTFLRTFFLPPAAASGRGIVAVGANASFLAPLARAGRGAESGFGAFACFSARSVAC